ncbi:hypothetical protein [Pantanalinema sp. GBBB05]
MSQPSAIVAIGLSYHLYILDKSVALDRLLSIFKLQAPSILNHHVL